jgi:hypothetical protein
MVALQAGTGFGGAAKGLFNRHRVAILSVVLSLVGIATGTATAMAVLQNASAIAPLVIGAGVVLAGACAFAQTRHLGLAIMTAIVPLPGLLWAAPLSAGANYGVVPLLAYAFAFAWATLGAQAAVERALDRLEHEYPWRTAVVALGLAIVLAAFWFWTMAVRDAAIQALADLVFSTFSAAALLPLGASVLHFDESFVARANRAREHRQRLLERLSLLATPRWGLSVTGIAVVFIAIAWFETGPAMRTGGLALVLRCLSVAVVAVGAGVFARGWREGLATGLAVGAVCLVALWATAQGERDPLAPVGVLEVVSLGLLLALHGARGALLFRVRGEAPVVARQRTIEETGPGQLFAAAGGLLAIVPALIVWPACVPFVAALAAAGIGGLLWWPAAATALETLVPHHRSVEEIYGTRKKAKA